MDRSGWTRDPVVAVAGGGLALECIGWVVWIVHSMATGTEPWDVRVLGIFVGTATLLVACAVAVLRGRRLFAVVAACVVLLFTAFTGPAATLVNITVVALLTWANARLRGPAGEAGRAARRDPVVLLAGGGCAAAAGAIVARIGIRLAEDMARYPWPVWPDLRIVLQAVPALVLAAAVAGILRGSPRWAAVALAAIVVGGGTAVTRAEGIGPVTALVAVTLALLVAVGFAGERLLRHDDGPGREPGEPERSDRTP